MLCAACSARALRVLLPSPTLTHTHTHPSHLLYYYTQVVFDVASQAHGHLEKARALSYSPGAVYALLPALRSSMYLQQLREVDFDPVHPSLLAQESHLPYQLKCLWAAISKKI